MWCSLWRSINCFSLQYVTNELSEIKVVDMHNRFVCVLKISRNSRIEAPLLQYASIMIQNMTSEYAIYYCFRNDYINNIITHPYEFDRGDLAQCYVSFLRFGFSLSISFLAFAGYKLNISLEITCLVFCFQFSMHFSFLTSFLVFFILAFL
ncbi:hypothetical protein UlMin_008975 [Ulmus minor]